MTDEPLIVLMPVDPPLKHSATKILEGPRALVGLNSMPLRLAKRRPHLPGQPKLKPANLLRLRWKGFNFITRRRELPGANSKRSSIRGEFVTLAFGCHAPPTL